VWCGQVGRAAALLSALVLAGCAAGQATPTPIPTDTSPPATTQPALPTPTPNPSVPAVTPTATPLPTSSPPGPSGTLLISWDALAPANGLDDLAVIWGQANSATRFVLVGVAAGDHLGQYHEEPAIWWSTDARQWHKATLPLETVNSGEGIWDVAAGGPGFVAATNGGLIWSVDGETWLKAAAPDLGWGGRVSAIGVATGGLIAYGRNEFDNTVAALQSADGKTWTTSARVGNVLGQADVTFVSTAGSVTVFRRESSVTEVWRVVAPDDWTRLATVKDYLYSPSFGPLGWLAFGEKGVWLSADGRDWTRGSGTQPLGSVGTSAVLETGYVAATTTPGPGCDFVGHDVGGQTWTSVDGRDWRQMPQAWQGRWVDAFFIVDRLLVGIGPAWGPDIDNPANRGAVWTADLPVSAPLAGPLPTPLPSATPVSGGC
jgi:hypothetical protein